MDEDDTDAALAQKMLDEAQQFFEEDIGYVEWLLKLEKELDRTCPRE